MGYWSNDGAYIYDEKDLNTKVEESYKFKPTGEATTGSIYDADEKTTEGIERMIKGQKERESYKFRPTGEVTTGSIYDADEKTTEGIERMVKGQKEKDLPKKKIINDILNNFPSNSEELKSQLEKVNYRLDLMKMLVEGYKNQFINISNQYKDVFTPEASEIVNNKLTEYLCLIETLKSAGYNFGSTANSYNDSTTMHQFDPHRPDVGISEIMSIMFSRRKNGADINIIFPVDYDLTSVENQPKADAVTIINNVDKHLQNNPYVSMFWSKAGYIPQQNNSSRSM